MQAATLPFNVGVSILLRWILLLALCLLLVLNLFFTLQILIVLALAGLWNVTLSVFMLQGKQFPSRQALVVLIDLAFAIALFFYSHTLLGPLAWAGLLPVASAALLFGLQPSLVLAAAITLLFAALAAIDLPLAEIPFPLAAPAIAFFLTAATCGLGAQQGRLRHKQQQDLESSHREEADRRERERLKALYEVTSTLNSSLVFDQVLDLALDLGTNALVEKHEGVSRAVGGILLFHEGGLRVAAARRLAAKDLGRVLPGKQGILAEVLGSGEAQVMAEVSKDAEFSLLSGLQNCQSLYCTPLRFGLDLFGVIFFAHPQPDFFNEERRETVDTIARQVMSALQNAQLYEALNEEKERITLIQEQARKQLARNLHDGPTQSIAAIAMRVNLARRLLSKDVGAAGEELYKLEELARRTTKEVRHMLFTLRPQTLENSGLVAALKDLAFQVHDSYEQDMTVEADAATLDRMDLGKQGVLFYIAAEAVSNARKHAKAKNIRVRLSQSERDIVLLEVEDDGSGFTPQEAAAKREADGSVGLETLRERVELISGVMRLDSQPGMGTKLRVWVPVNESAAQRLRQGLQ
jgi:signal transduction histidine kinase